MSYGKPICKHEVYPHTARAVSHDPPCIPQLEKLCAVIRVAHVVREAVGVGYIGTKAGMCFRKKTLIGSWPPRDVDAPST